MTAPRPHAAVTTIDPALPALYDIALAWEAGADLDTVAAALAERLGTATGADRVVLVADGDTDRPARPLAVWDVQSGPMPPPHTVSLPDDPDRLPSALGYPAGAAVSLTARGRRVGAAVLVGHLPNDPDLAKRLAVPAGLVLGAALHAHEEAERAERMDRLSSLTRDLMSIVSHELRTPLTSIIGSLQTLQRAGVDPASPEGRRLIGSALARTERLRSLIEDLLITARPETPVRTKIRAVDPAAAVRRAVASVPGAAAVATIDVEPSLGPILLDGPNLDRLLVNLLDNAVRHGGGGPVVIGASREGQIVVFTVADHGPGLPPTIARTLLDRHADSADSTLRPAGPGLGLTITKGIIEGFGGTLRHETTPGGGATFVVEIPFRDGR